VSARAEVAESASAVASSPLASAMERIFMSSPLNVR
jgi:hypothetical protein